MSGDRSVKPWFEGFGGLIGISIGLAAIAWVVDSILDSVIFHDGTLIGQLLSPTAQEIGVRVLFGFVLIVFGTYTHLNMDRRKHVEETLRQSEEKYRMLVENVQEGVFIIQGGKLQYVNEAFARTAGYNVGEIIGRDFRNFVAPDDLEMVADRYSRRQAGENIPTEYEFRLMRKDGTKIVVNMNVGLVTYSGMVASMGILKDITEQKRAEKALEDAVVKAVEEKNKSNAIIAALGDGIIIQDTDYKIIYQNQVQDDLFGNRIEEYCYKAYEGRDTICEWCPVEITFRDGKIHRTDREVNTESGTMYYELTSSPLRDSTGKIVAGIKVVRNITERKRAEEKLREGEQFLASIFESIQDGIGIIDKDMNVIHVNTTTERWYPHTSRFIGRKCYEVYHGRSERCEACPAWRTLKTGESAHDVVPKHGPGGKEVGWAEIYSFPLFDTTKGQMKGVIEYVRDVTERKRVEEEIKNYTREIEESNRMKELFADIMHHDLLNPLTTANGFIELLKENETSSRKIAYLETVERSLVKGMELIDSAMKYSKFESLESIELEELDLKKIIDEVIEALTPLADNAGMEIINRITLNTPVRANRIIEEVFLNIISNAIKYASSGKRIIIESENKGESLQVRVIDFGEGIKESDKTMIFERFRRGGKTGVKGSGLGLAIAGKIMELHNGKIWVEDNPEGGSIFIVEIPGNLN